MITKQKEIKKQTLKAEAFLGTEHFIKVLFSVNKENYGVNEKDTANWVRNLVNIFENGVI